jgi:hypothetical protein
MAIENKNLVLQWEVLGCEIEWRMEAGKAEVWHPTGDSGEKS